MSDDLTKAAPAVASSFLFCPCAACGAEPAPEPASHCWWCGEDLKPSSDTVITRPFIALPSRGALEKLAAGECSQSWIPKAVHCEMGRDLAPGTDIVAFLESPDGILNQLRIIVVIAGKPDAPRVIQESGASCRLSVLWNEVEIVDRVLLSFPRHSSLLSFLSQLVGAFSHLSEVAECWQNSMMGAAMQTGCRVLVCGKEWDGHTAADVVTRLREWVHSANAERSGPAAQDEL